MAIRKIEYTKGEELNIRSFPRIENKVIFENINSLLEAKDQNIVKCGKSYWDVTQAPEIFEQAEEFDPNELTGIEKKELQQTAPPVLAYEEKEVAIPDPMSMLYQKTEEEEEEPEYLLRKTFYLTELVAEIIETYRYAKKLEISETVRELILQGTPPEILEMAQRNLQSSQVVRAAAKKTKKKKKRIII